jgi:transcriptional regulator with PAS, ATPase and Fis domain
MTGDDSDCFEFCGIRTRVPAMERVLDTVAIMAELEAPVLIHGETGTGKELVARALHKLSARSRKPLVTVHCGALPESLAESELFGHERGAFTGADRSYAGRIESAAGGSLFLDEINSLSLATQAKLLRFLEMQEISRIGRQHPLIVDTRLISATNVPLDTLVATGRMRSDFFYRLNVLVVELPPLRERVADIPLLATQFLAEDPLARRLGVTALADEAIAELVRLPWPGNVRELKNVVRRSLIHGTKGTVLRHVDAGINAGTECPTHVDAPQRSTISRSVPSFRTWMRESEREYLSELVDRHRSVAEQARASGLPERTLYRKIRNLRCSTHGTFAAAPRAPSAATA